MPKMIPRPIKVLHVIHTSGITGPGKILYGIAKNLDKKEFLVDVLCPESGQLADDLRKIGLTIIPLRPGGQVTLWDVFKLRKALKLQGYHILHIHSGKISFWAKIVGKIVGVQVIVFTEHFAADSHSWIKNKFALFLHLFFHRFSDAMTDCVVAVSESAKQSFILRQNVDSDKVVTIYNGVDLEEFKRVAYDMRLIKEKWRIPQDCAVIGVVGRLSLEKGQRCFVMAAQEVVKENPKVRFFIVGDGPEKGNIIRLIADLGLEENCILTGFLDDVSEVMEIMDIVVQPSIALESFGLTLVEAMARKKPVIASDRACFREIIQDKENGILFSSGDSHALAEKIILLLKDARLREKLAENGQKTVEVKFDIRITAQKTQALYKRLLEKKRKGKGYRIGDEEPQGLVDTFIGVLARERNLPHEKTSLYRHTLTHYISFIKDGEITLQEAAEYLAQVDNFLVETFLQFVEQKKVFLDATSLFNSTVFKEALRLKAVTAQDYDERIRMQTLQFQIDNYYQPKDEAQRKRIAIVLSELLPKRGEKILDVGCGVGTFAYHCAQQGAQAVGIDYSPASIETAKKLCSHFRLSEKAEFFCGDIANRLPFPDNSFDKIAAIDFIEHIDEIQKKNAISEMIRVLKPQGRIVIFTPNGLREKLGAAKAGVRRSLGAYEPETRLHFGLTDRFAFEKALKNMKVQFHRKYFDVGRPYLAKLPFINEFLSLNIVWVIKKK